MFNKAIIIGNLGADPEMQDVNGTPKAKLRIATSRKWTDKQGNKQEKTQWHNVSVWGKQAENCARFLSKGRQVAVEGEIEYSEYEKDGVKRYFTDIRANSVTFLSGQNQGGQNQGAQNTQNHHPASPQGAWNSGNSGNSAWSQGGQNQGGQNQGSWNSGNSGGVPF